MDTYSALALTQTVVIFAAVLPDPTALYSATDSRSGTDAELRLTTAVALSAVVGGGLGLIGRSWTPIVVTALTSLILAVGADTLIRAQPADRILS